MVSSPASIFAKFDAVQKQVQQMTAKAKQQAQQKAQQQRNSGGGGGLTYTSGSSKPKFTGLTETVVPTQTPKKQYGIKSYSAGQVLGSTSPDLMVGGTTARALPQTIASNTAGQQVVSSSGGLTIKQLNIQTQRVQAAQGSQPVQTGQVISTVAQQTAKDVVVAAETEKKGLIENLIGGAGAVLSPISSVQPYIYEAGQQTGKFIRKDLGVDLPYFSKSGSKLSKEITPFLTFAGDVASDVIFLGGAVGVGAKALKGSKAAVKFTGLTSKIPGATQTINKTGKALTFVKKTKAGQVASKVASKTLTTKGLIGTQIGGFGLQLSGSAIQEPIRDIATSIQSSNLKGTPFETGDIEGQNKIELAVSQSISKQFTKLQKEKEKESKSNEIVPQLIGLGKGFVLGSAPESYFLASGGAQKELKKTFKEELKSKGFTFSDKQVNALYEARVSPRITGGVAGMTLTETGSNVIGAGQIGFLLQGKGTQSALLKATSGVKRASVLAPRLAAGSLIPGAGEGYFSVERQQKFFGTEKTEQAGMEKLIGAGTGSLFAAGFSGLGGAAIGFNPKVGSFLYLRGGQAIDVPGEFLGDLATDVSGLSRKLSVSIPTATGTANVLPTGEVKDVTDTKTQQPIQQINQVPINPDTNVPVDDDLPVAEDLIEKVDEFIPDPSIPIPVPINENTNVPVDKDVPVDEDLPIDESITNPNLSMQQSLVLPIVTNDRFPFLPPLMVPMGSSRAKRGTKLTYISELDKATKLFYASMGSVSGKYPARVQSKAKGNKLTFIKKKRSKKK